MLVSVCIASYQRPEGLKRLLLGLNQLTFNQSEVPDIEVIVIDNDFKGSARGICRQIETDFQWQLKYYIEAQRGISFARNRAIASVSQDSQFVAFIDDDEVPENNWLDELLSVQKAYRADVVAGPVIPNFIKDVPQWVAKGKFFEPRRYPTGHPIEIAFAGNVLIRTEILQKIDPVFDERFAITGGEDTNLFMRLRRAGYKFVWANEAIVHEWIPQSRTNIKWVLQRGYFGWSVHSWCESELYPSIPVIAIRILKGLTLIIKGLFLILPSLFLGQHALIKALLNIYRGAGTLAGLIGIRYQAYKVTHGV
ncbi:glycosyltransferase family 2 protein [Calothrix sp. UHCC 0171]|uniref:glycosyltransferase family 2 protein n=1 Tax=Calothrix sp. UHCC 0171 TaxID=3110245 RepID=UPI002B1E937E|nr:glycosyltransferase [Calothrix sp. UHCC 0171]MEA5570617.1 glycosyltransferase [Calothrix sp. UHCC 0171]